MPLASHRSFGRPRCRAALGLGLAMLLGILQDHATADELPADHAQRQAAGLELFKSDVRGILSSRCLKCHGGETTEGKFDLATRDALLKGGESGPAIVLYKAQESNLYKLIAHAAEPQMPFEATKLSDAAIGQIAKWIDCGAPYDQPLKGADAQLASAKITEAQRSFWSFQPLHEAVPPTVKGDSRVRTPIDRFVLAKLEAKNLSLSPPADRRRLLRRATLDLTGVPPTPDEIASFLQDSSDGAYDAAIDRLLNNPHYGERWGRHWLDLARFAESHGYEQDYDRPSAYHYRDFVIKALNEDMPYDRFVAWQIAGDELEPNNLLALMATGFLAAGTHATQITANQAEKERYDELDDMAATVGTAMLGLTIGCARCHDHKFDPIPQHDYYRMISTFTTTVRSEVALNLQPEQYLAAKAKFDREHLPLSEALSEYEREQSPGKLAAWLKEDVKPTRPRWLILEPKTAKAAGGVKLDRQSDGSFLASGPNPATTTYTFETTTRLENITALRLEALADASLPKQGPGRADNGNFALSDLRVTATPLDGKSPAVELKWADPLASFEQKGLPLSHAIDADAKSAWAVDGQIGKSHTAVFPLAEPLPNAGGCTLVISLKFENNAKHAIGRPRLSISATGPPAALDGDAGMHDQVVEVERVLALPADKRVEKDVQTLLAWHRTTDPRWRELRAAVDEHLKQSPAPDLTKVLICSEGVPAVRLHTQGPDFYEKTFFLKRGDLNQKQGEAPAGFLQALMPSPDRESLWRLSPPWNAHLSFRRASLAKWLTDSHDGAGRLLARVIVNRLWQHHFGEGIVTTPSDFGAQGARPTHPALLHWLAAELIRNNWRLKPLHKLMMTSAVYMQGAEFNPSAAAVDRENQLLWRRRRARLEAEPIRDSMLSVSGSLDERMFGPGTLDQGQRRRSIYFTIKRSQLIPLMVLFDAPDSLQGLGQRASTIVAPQALALLNNSHLRSYAQEFAKKLTTKYRDSPGKAIESAYVAALSRPPSVDESSDARSFIEQQLSSYRSAQKPNAEELALADFCHALMSLNEFIYVD